ncbi:Elevenin Receptor, partial [Frankliniella occidentalis]
AQRGRKHTAFKETSGRLPGVSEERRRTDPP